jgi:hypothetical protein
MGCIGEFARQVLPGEVQLLMQVCPPFGAIGHIIDCIAAKLQFCDNVGGEVHAGNYTGYCYTAKKNLLICSGDFQVGTKERLCVSRVREICTCDHRQLCLLR